MPGYHPLDRTLVISPGTAIHLEELRLIPEGQQAAADDLVSFEFRSEPPGARLFIGEEDRGVTPLRMGLPPGAYRVRLELPAHRPAVELVEVQPGQSAWSIRLDRLRCLLTILSEPKGATVLIDGAAVCIDGNLGGGHIQRCPTE